MMGNVLQFPSKKGKVLYIRPELRPKPPPVIHNDLAERIIRIKESLNKINMLMAELRVVAAPSVEGVCETTREKTNEGNDDVTK